MTVICEGRPFVRFVRDETPVLESLRHSPWSLRERELQDMRVVCSTTLRILSVIARKFIGLFTYLPTVSSIQLGRKNRHVALSMTPSLWNYKIALSMMESTRLLCHKDRDVNSPKHGRRNTAERSTLEIRPTVRTYHHEIDLVFRNVPSDTAAAPSNEVVRSTAVSTVRVGADASVLVATLSTASCPLASSRSMNSFSSPRAKRVCCSLEIHDGVFIPRHEMRKLFNGIDACSHTMRDSDHMPVDKNSTSCIGDQRFPPRCDRRGSREPIVIQWVGVNRILIQISPSITIICSLRLMRVALITRYELDTLSGTRCRRHHTESRDQPQIMDRNSSTGYPAVSSDKITVCKIIDFGTYYT